MADSRKLKKHLASIRATEKMAGAMKTVATAKFSKLSAANADFARYSAACGGLMGGFSADVFAPYSGGDKSLYVLFSGNKGLCGGYNSELVSYYLSQREENSGLIVCGKKGFDILAAKGYKAVYFSVEDIPTYDSAALLLAEIEKHLPQYGRVKLVYRSFVNALKYPLAIEDLLPKLSADVDHDDTLYFPDKNSIAPGLARLCLTARLYGTMLQAATGAQAATLMTMRSAADNAKEEAFKTETAINRERQNALTAGVIESASGMWDE